MLDTALAIFAWGAVAFVGLALGLMAANKERGLTLIQHRADMLPQAMLVRYAGLGALALVAAVFGAPRLLFAMLLAFAVIGLGDALVYRHAGHPFWMHLAVGALAGIGAVIAAVSIA